MDKETQTKIPTLSDQIHFINEKNHIEDIIQINFNYKNKIQIIISELGFIFIFGIIILISYLIKDYHKKKIFTSKEKIEFKEDPLILIHTTDLHFSTKRTHRTDGSSIFMMSLFEYKPDLFLLTGDYVDNLRKKDEMGLQNLEDWNLYKKLIFDLIKDKGIQVIDISGNHDQWGVDKVNSKENNYLDNSFIFNRNNTKNEKDFFLKKLNLNINNINLTFLLINDYRYPVYRPPYGLEPHTTKVQYDLLENEINSIEESEIFILSHYPMDRALLYKSSKGNSFEKIISNKKIYAIFSGHLHPDNVQIIHHGSEGGLEFCTPAPYNRKRAGVITLDNNNLIYHEVFIPYYGSKPLFFLTYPVPVEQLTSHHVFCMNNFDIRVISYYPDKNIQLIIEGDINGYMIYKSTLKNGANLFIYSVKDLNEGIYNIHIYDKDNICNIKTKFTVNTKYAGKKEKYTEQVRFLLTFRFLIIPFFIILLIIVFPFFPSYNLKIVKNIEKNIEGIYNTYSLNKVLLYIYLIILSPFFLRYRIQSNKDLKNIIRYLLFISFIYPLILPVHFMQSIKGQVGYSFLSFIVLGKNIKYEHWSLQMTFIYYVGTLFPFILFASGKKYYNKNNISIIIINSFLCIALFIFSFIINFLTVGQSISFGFLFFSTSFVFVFIIILIFFIKYFF